MKNIKKGKFGRTLSQCIDDTDLSKETIIKKMKIDRSSFYQYLNGKRTVSKQTFRKVYRILALSSNLDPYRFSELIDSYEEEYLIKVDLLVNLETTTGG